MVDEHVESRRDLKPDNVLLDASRTHAKLADLGMSRLVGHSAEGRLTGGCVTAWYRAPEIMLGDPAYGATLHAVDAWAAGCVLVEMANLSPAFAYETEVECMLAVFRALGTPTPSLWPGADALPHFQPAFPHWPPHPASELLCTEAAGCPGLAPLVDRLLVLHPPRRIPAAAALAFLQQISTISHSVPAGAAHSLYEEEDRAARLERQAAPPP